VPQHWNKDNIKNSFDSNEHEKKNDVVNDGKKKRKFLYNCYKISFVVERKIDMHVPYIYLLPNQAFKPNISSLIFKNENHFEYFTEQH
jgi:hypothetical protein